MPQRQGQVHCEVHIPAKIDQYDRRIIEQFRRRRKLEGAELTGWQLRRLAFKPRSHFDLAPKTVLSRVTQSQLTSLTQMTSLREQMTSLSG